MRRCKDCGPGLKRPAPHPGPRCATHHRAARRAARDAAHDAYVLRTYGITGDQYWALYAAQGARCALCQRATGRSKRLAVDHDHRCCVSVPTCGQCVRGLLCRTCNKLLGHLRDDPDAFRRGSAYLEWPPAQAVIYGNGKGR